MNYSKNRERLIGSLRREIHNERVLEALGSIPREVFVPPELAQHAYDDNALPIGEGQTISQPLMVGIMLQALDPQPDDTVLDVGTGSGYQAAVLAHLSAKVISVERIGSLADRAREVLRHLDCTNVEVHIVSDVLGWPEGAPYEGIVVAAAAPSVPTSLLDQLAVGGRLVMPVGTPFDQNLVRVTKRETGHHIEWLGPCRFVHLIGAEGWPDDDIPTEPAV